MALKLITPPKEEPVSLDEAKADLRVDSDFLDHDALIQGYITAGRMQAETICRRVFVTQSWCLTVDRFPSPMSGRLTEYWLGQSWGLSGMGGVSQFSLTDRTGFGFQLPISPLASVDSIQYLDAFGTLQTMPPGDHKVDCDSEPPRVMPAYGKTWPSTRQEINAVKLNFTAGFGNKDTVPNGIKAAIIMYCKAHYESGFTDAKAREYERRMAAFDALLTPYRVLTLL